MRQPFASFPFPSLLNPRSAPQFFAIALPCPAPLCRYQTPHGITSLCPCITVLFATPRCHAVTPLGFTSPCRCSTLLVQTVPLLFIGYQFIAYPMPIFTMKRINSTMSRSTDAILRFAITFHRATPLYLTELCLRFA